MSFNTALTSPQLTQLRRKRWSGDQYISFCDNVYALAARVNGAINASTGTTAAVIVYDTVTSGAYTNIDEGMTVIVSPTTDIRDPLAVRLHIRYLGANSTQLYVSEFSDPISDNAYLFVLYHYDVIDNLSRPVGTDPVVQYQQYDQAFQRMAPVIVGLQSGYANWVNGSGNYDIAFDISASFAAESGRTISSYAYSVKPTGSGTATVIAGSAATATVTYRFTYGEYWLKAVITDSGGVTWFQHVLIKAHDRTNYLPQTHFDGAEITRDVHQGQSARIKGYAGLSTLLNGTMCIIWVDEQYSDPDFSNAAGSLFNNIDLVGWIEVEENMYVTDPTYSAYKNVSFEVQGLGPRLSRLEGQMLAIQNNSSPTLWDQINNLTPWRSIVHFLQRHTTALQLGGFTADSVDNTFLFPTIVTNAGRALDNVTGNQGIADEINAQLEFASDGRMYLTRREPFVATDLSHTPIIVATWSGQDLIGQAQWKFNHYLQYGLLDADGAAWNGTVNVPVMPCKSRAPGLAQASGADQGKLNNQILVSVASVASAQSELAQRAGTQWAMDNNTGVLTINHPAQFHWLQPSYGQVYIWSLDTTFNVRGWTLGAGTHWMLKSVTVRHENKTGSRTVEGSYIPVVTGNPGANIPIINPNSIALSLPTLPPLPAFPDIEIPLWPDAGLLPSQVTPDQLTGSGISTDGNSLLVATATRAYLLSNVIKLTTPGFVDVTPADLGSFQIKAVAISPFFTSSAVPAYILASDGTNSAVWYTSNVANGTAGWTKGATIPAVYSIIRTTSTAGSVLIYAASDSSGQTTSHYDFTRSDGGWAANPSFPGAFWTNGVGWQAGDGTALGIDRRNADIYVNIADPTVLGISFTYNLTKGTYSPSPTTAIGVGATPTTLYTSQNNTALSDGNGLTFSWTGSQAATDARVALLSSLTDPSAGFSGSATITSATVITDSGAAGSGAVVRLSVNNGLSWGSAVSVGTSPGSVGGFDVQRAGANSFAAAGGKVYRATTLGGAYSAYYTITGTPPEAACIVIPYFNWSGTKQTGATNPDIVIALTGADGSSRSLLWIEGGATPGTVHDITPVASSIFDNANAVTVSYNHHIALFCKVSGTYKLYRTTDKGSTWTLVESLSAPKYIRGRRNDNSAAVSGSNKGQLYLADSNLYFSSKWASAAPSVRNVPGTPIVSLDTIY